MMNLPQGHYSCGQGDERQGMEVGKMRDDKMDGSEDHDEEGEPNILALGRWTDNIMELLE